MKRLFMFLPIAVLVLHAACSKAPETGPGEVHWDRDTCARCIMAVSDPHFSAQIRGAEDGSKTKLYFFDDIGCAVFWLADQAWKDDPRTEIWVNDWRNGDWINAETASYLAGMTTPMDFGLGAQLEEDDGTFDYAAAVKHIHNRRQRAH